jgi:integrase
MNLIYDHWLSGITVTVRKLAEADVAAAADCSTGKVLHSPGGVGVVSRSMAQATARKVWASMARVVQRCQDLRAIVSYLTSPETDALLAAPDRTTWYGRRDHALLLTTVQTGLRVSEVTGLTIQDITTTTPGAAVHTTGKGRKGRGSATAPRHGHVYCAPGTRQQ